MPSPPQLLPTLEFPKLAEKKISIAALPSYDSTQRAREQAKFDLAIMAKTCESATIWPPHPSSLYPETKAKLKVFCIKCDNPEDDERDWQGRVIGRGLHGSLSASLTRVKHKYRLFMAHEPLIKLLTVCIECYTKLDLYHEVDQIDQVFGFRDSKCPPEFLDVSRCAGPSEVIGEFTGVDGDMNMGHAYIGLFR